jgi:hypothetical protein
MSEFSTPNLASMAFPTLFPDGRGDPFAISANYTDKTRLLKIRHLMLYGRLVSRFAEHPRFVLWCYNIFVRHRMLSQGDIYTQQCPGDANMSVEQIRELMEGPDRANRVLKNMRRYMANIPGTPSYWYNVSEQVKATIESKGPPHAFFTFTFADR